MEDPSRFTTEALRSIGLAAMELSGRGLTRVAAERRGQLYTLSDGRRVRLRTNNDRRVIVTTDDTRSNAKLDLDGCDFVLLVVPEQRRKRGQVEAGRGLSGALRRDSRSLRNVSHRLAGVASEDRGPESHVATLP